MKCTSRPQLSQMLQAIIDYSGEGVMLRKPFSVYEHGRSNLLLKLKVCHCFHLKKLNAPQAVQVDREALVTEVHANGSFELQLYVHSQSHNNKNSLKLRHNLQQPIPITYILFVVQSLFFELNYYAGPMGRSLKSRHRI